MPGADPGVQAVSLQVTVSHPPVGRLPLLSARPAITSPAAEHHRPLAGTKLYCLVTEAHRCEQLAQGCYAALPRVGFEPATYWSQSPMLYPLHYRATANSSGSSGTVYCGMQQHVHITEQWTLAVLNSFHGALYLPSCGMMRHILSSPLFK